MPKTKSEIDDAAKQFLIDQEEYNRTHDKEILWFRMEPYIRETASSMLKLKSNNHFIKSFDNKVDTVVDKLMKRYTEQPDYKYNLPLTMVYWVVISVIYSDESKNLDMEEKVAAIEKERLYEQLYRNGEII